MDLEQLVEQARRGDLAAYGGLVEATQRMVYALVGRIVRHRDDAQDAAQETYLTAFRRLAELRDPAAFTAWLRRIAINTAQRLRRSRRAVFVDAPDVLDAPDVPVLDEQEDAWTSEQRQCLAAALLKLDDEERLLCDRHYHGGWNLIRLAQAAGVSEAAMRKRMQRIRDRLRKEIEMAEQQSIAQEGWPENLHAKVVELLAKPRLLDLPENPVGRIWDMIKALLPQFTAVQVPEIVEDRAVEEAFGPQFIRPQERDGRHVHRIDAGHYLRPEMTIALLLAMRGRSGPQHVLTAGKVYRKDNVDSLHLESFHQAELLVVRPGLGAWDLTPTLFGMVEQLFPGRRLRLAPFDFTPCTHAWELEMEWDDGRWADVLAWGQYKDPVLRWLGNDPSQYGAIGVGLGLERLACLRFGIDDLRKVETARISK